MITVLLKRCNDFGAGGVSVAIGELTDGLDINLDKVQKEIRRAGQWNWLFPNRRNVWLSSWPEHVDEFMKYAAEENLEATIVAVATDTKRLVMHWRDQNVVNITRAFLDTNGVTQHRKADVVVAPEDKDFFKAPEVKDVAKTWLDTMGNPEYRLGTGLAERFDSTIGARTVLMPFGGKCRRRRSSMVAKIPVEHGNTTAWPNIATWL